MPDMVTVLLILAACGTLVFAWVMFNNEMTFRLIIQADNAVYNYQTAQLNSFRSIEDATEQIKAYNNFNAEEAYKMLYSYHYVFWHPWLTSAIKPEYRELLKPYIKEATRR